MSTSICNKSASRTYNTRPSVGCDRALRYCRSFGFQKSCCKPNEKPDEVSVPLPLGCNDLIVVLMFPFLNDPLNNQGFDKKLIDLGRTMKTRLVKGVDFSGSVFPLASDVIEFNDIDYNFLNSFTIKQIAISPFLDVLVTVEKQADGSFFVRTSTDSTSLANELTDSTFVEITIDSDIPTVCPEFTTYSPEPIFIIP